MESWMDVSASWSQIARWNADLDGLQTCTLNRRTSDTPSGGNPVKGSTFLFGFHNLVSNFVHLACHEVTALFVHAEIWSHKIIKQIMTIRPLQNYCFLRRLHDCRWQKGCKLHLFHRHIVPCLCQTFPHWWAHFAWGVLGVSSASPSAPALFFVPSVSWGRSTPLATLLIWRRCCCLLSGSSSV